MGCGGGTRQYVEAVVRNERTRASGVPDRANAAVRLAYASPDRFSMTPLQVVNTVASWSHATVT